MSSSTLDAKIVQQIVRRHDADMDEARTYMGMAKAAYGGRFWEWVHDEGRDHTDRKYRLFEDRYELNLIKKGINTYHAALFPKRMAAVVGRNATTTGDSDKAKLLLNSWLFTDTMRARIDTAIRQALLYNGAGLKVSYEPRAGQAHKSLAPHERVYARVFPWYELVLDRMAKDADDARFIGHVYHKPKRDVAELYDIPESDLRGDREVAFLDEQYDGQTNTARGLGGESDIEGDYVRVLELCNLVDHYGDNDYPGRFEVHLIDQGELSMEPVYVGEMPLWRPDGRPIPHILPMIFEHEAEYPLQGIAPCRSWLHQQAEVNAYRSQMASESRKNKTIFLYDKNLGSDIIQKIANARSMDGIAIDPDNVLGGDLRRAVVPIEQPPINVNVREHAMKAENDLISSFNFSPSAIGITQNVTAQEIRYQRDFTDSEFGRYAASRDRTMSQLAFLALRAFVAAMLDDGDMESTYADDLDADADLEMADLSDDADAAQFDGSSGSILAEADEEIDKRLFDADSLDMAEEDEDEDEDEEPEEMSPELVESLDDELRIDDDSAELYAERGIETTGEETIQLLDAKGDLLIITVEDIDSEFEIGFTETGRTPASDAEIRANLSQLLPIYMQLFDVVMQGGAQAIIATEAARAYYSEYSLPENLNPDRLVAQLEAQSKEQPAAPGGAPPPQGGMPAPGGAPPEAAPPEQGAPEQGAAPQGGDPAAALDALVAAHGENPEALQALQVIVQALQSAPPELAQQLTDQLMQVAALPAETQVEGLVMLATALTEQAPGAAPAPEAAPAPAPAEAAPQAEAPAPAPAAAAPAPAPQAAQPQPTGIEARLADAAPDLEDALGLAERVVPQMQEALDEQGQQLLQAFVAQIQQALTILQSIGEGADPAASIEEAAAILEQAEDTAETLSQLLPAEMQRDTDALIEAISDAADALQGEGGEGGIDETDLEEDEASA